jgi:ubiquinone/menaquinone biosynthesis C-methylase UbiE
MKRTGWVRTVSLWALVALVGHVLPAAAQEQSLRPGINKQYAAPQMGPELKRLEGEGREIYRGRMEIVDACQLKPGMVVADIGAGTGLFTRLMAPKLGPRGKLFAVDITRKFLDYIEKTCAQQKISGVETVLSNDTSVSLPRDSIDLAFICDTYHHFEYPYKMLASIRTALRPGGRMILIDFQREKGVSPGWVLEHVRAGKRTVIDEVTAAGFRLVGQCDILQGQYLLRFVKAAEETRPLEKIVYTHVMHQVAIGAVNGRGQTHLSVEPTRWNGMMALHLPEYVANYGKPLAAARQDIAMMKAAGVNTIGLLLGNKHLPNSQFAAMIHAYYQAALEDGEIKIVPDVWGDLTQPEALADALALVKQKYEPAWLKRKGRLVISLWLDYGSHPLPDYGETTRRLCAKIGGREQVFFVFYSPAALATTNPQWLAGADALTDWVHDSYASDQGLLREAMAAARAAGKEFWQPVMPSFTQSRYPHPGITPNVREMLGMTWFREAWLAAIHADAPAVCLQTWNDLSEDSSVMPESNHGYAYFELNKYYARWFQQRRPPQLETEQVLLFHHPQIVEGVQLPEGRKAMEGFPVSHGKRFQGPQEQRTPPTDYLGVVAMLKSPAKVAVMLGETVIAQRELPAGVTSWLIYQPRNLNDPRKLYPCDPQSVYPRPERDFLVTTLDQPFWDAEVYLAVYRGDDRVGFFRSHRPIASAAARGELTTVGDAFRLGPAEK